MYSSVFNQARRRKVLYFSSYTFLCIDTSSCCYCKYRSCVKHPMMHHCFILKNQYSIIFISFLSHFNKQFLSLTTHSNTNSYVDICIFRNKADDFKLPIYFLKDFSFDRLVKYDYFRTLR
jgi:hypothetical protein